MDQRLHHGKRVARTVCERHDFAPRGDRERCRACGFERATREEFTVEGACGECLGLGWFTSHSDAHGEGVERCDNCSVFSSDDAATVHALGLVVTALRNPRPRRGKRFEAVLDALRVVADRFREESP